ncbi:hypothetical protein CPAR01_07819 [Colletotrichum paranaense]|uniref:Secreted protein n=1 Tax=Colletotrichum paranaense TaxID=1914294 RepID=A0ABQ9SIG6_9PEZI|nr:uncharacterized protein CPAR01_07819 [Colletotrichum paranaense]KAK1537706.1 hypothetical protein CPAR01_07819 [Colletotrichum paranaense]
MRTSAWLRSRPASLSTIFLLSGYLAGQLDLLFASLPSPPRIRKEACWLTRAHASSNTFPEKTPPCATLPRGGHAERTEGLVRWRSLLNTPL